MLRGPLLSTVVLALVTGVALLALLFGSDRRVAGTPTPHCVSLQLLFDTDEEMRRAVGALRDDERVREVRDERTQAQNHERLTAQLRAAGHHDLADAALVERTPASVRVVEAFGVDVEVLADRLRRQYRVNLVDVCEEPTEPE